MTWSDFVLQCLKANNIQAKRSASLDGVPPLRGLTEAKGDDQVEAVIENLRKVPKNRPQRERTLRATVANWFGNKLDEAAMDRIVGELVKRKMIAIDQGKVRYSLPH